MDKVIQKINKRDRTPQGQSFVGWSTGTQATSSSPNYYTVTSTPATYTSAASVSNVMWKETT